MSIGNLKDTGNQGNNLPFQWKVLQGLQAILDEVAQPLTCVDDSIKICDANGDTLNINANGSINTVIQNVAGTSVTTTTVGADVGLDVNIINNLPLEVNITEANDSILVYGNDGAVNRKIKTDAAGELQVDILTMPATFAEDTAHVSGNTGAFVLGVRNDLNTVMTNADGDYSPIAVNDKGAVAIQDGGGSLTVDAIDLDIRTLDCNDEVSLCANGNTVDSSNPLPVSLSAGVQITPNIKISENEIATTGSDVLSISFANIGTADAFISFDAGVTQEPVPPGVTINMDAGGLGNYYPAAIFAWDTQSNLGSKLLITYNT